ncbi:MAG: hypothetical protein KatS3mg028_1308 [Bacteroidia bacterium]|nr:MAG: hypothetical protein KatS3mg028_1308 [Bacteroidia bacterium]
MFTSRTLKNPNPANLIKTAIDAMLNSLDPYTNFIGEDDIEDYRFQTTGALCRDWRRTGKNKRQTLYHRSLRQFTLHLENGLVPGSEILSVNDKDISKLSVAEITNLIKGEAGTIRQNQIHSLPQSNTVPSKRISLPAGK